MGGGEWQGRKRRRRRREGGGRQGRSQGTCPCHAAYMCVRYKKELYHVNSGLDCVKGALDFLKRDLVLVKRTLHSIETAIDFIKRDLDSIETNG